MKYLVLRGREDVNREYEMGQEIRIDAPGFGRGLSLGRVVNVREEGDYKVYTTKLTDDEAEEVRAKTRFELIEMTDDEAEAARDRLELLSVSEGPVENDTKE